MRRNFICDNGARLAICVRFDLKIHLKATRTGPYNKSASVTTAILITGMKDYISEINSFHPFQSIPKNLFQLLHVSAGPFDDIRNISRSPSIAISEYNDDTPTTRHSLTARTTHR